MRDLRGAILAARAWGPRHDPKLLCEWSDRPAPLSLTTKNCALRRFVRHRCLTIAGGRTAHSRFKIPLDVMPDSVCKISKGTQLGKLIEKTSLIIWDEVPMQHRFCLEAVHTTLCDLRGSDSQTVPFGGIPCVFGGDFAQILQVVRHGSRSETVNAAFNSSRLWKRLELLFLRENMRVRTADDDIRRFVEWQRSLSYKKEMD